MSAHADCPRTFAQVLDRFRAAAAEREAYTLTAKGLDVARQLREEMASTHGGHHHRRAAVPRG